MYKICTVHICMYFISKYIQYIHAIYDTCRYAHAEPLMGVQPGPHAGVEDRHRTAPLGPGASRRASRGGAPMGPTLPDADRRLRPPRASCRESRVRSGPRTGAPERHGAAQPGSGAERRGPRRSAHVGRGRHPRSACGSESQPERHCRASPGTGEVAAGPSPSMQSGPGDYPP